MNERSTVGPNSLNSLILMSTEQGLKHATRDVFCKFSNN